MQTRFWAWLGGVALGVLAGCAALPPGGADLHRWSAQERRILESLWIESLGDPPPDPTNRVADDPAAAALGKKLFFDTGLSANGRVACGTCHLPEVQFTDRFPRGRGMGTTDRRTMPLAGAAYGTWFFWDGRKDSLWAQALGPPESPVEHGITRTWVALRVARVYRSAYEAVFGPLPALDPERLPRTASPNAAEPADRAAWQRLAPEVRDGVTRVFVNAGKAIEAYVRTIRHGPSRFDRYAAAVLRGREDPAAVLTPSEARGLRLFLGRAGCVGCHNGPLFTNGEFHALGVPDVPEVGHDPGRARGIRLVQADEFNCLSRWSDAPRSACGELEFLRYDPARQDGAFKTPSLRNVAGRPPYMHAGQFATLREVLEFYRKRSGEPGAPPELLHGDLTDRDLADLEAFLHTLSGEVSSL